MRRCKIASEMAHRILHRLAEAWQVDDNRIRWKEPTGSDALGFDWWPGDFCVGVRTNVLNDSEVASVIRVVVCVDFLKNIDINSGRFERLSIATHARRLRPTHGSIHPRTSGEKIPHRMTARGCGSVAQPMSRRRPLTGCQICWLLLRSCSPKCSDSGKHFCRNPWVRRARHHKTGGAARCRSGRNA